MKENQYWKAFAQETKSHARQNLRFELEKLFDSQLNELIVNSLTESLRIQQILHDWVVKAKEGNFLFYHAVMWHLTDALYGMPDCLMTSPTDIHIEKQRKVSRLTDYYSFLVAFITFAPKELVNLISLNNINYLTLIVSSQSKKIIFNPKN
ncbi:hypothetical protein ACIQZG_22065 [Lysinibacillus sp. NPDC096418]|uniref:hypothetical protein n=1 Tax=Lysinibacillus sp. NPDC096418 TaxID=3364138 RepID=UPI003820D981